MIAALAVAWLGILLLAALGWQLLRQNGRVLLRLDRFEKRLDELEFEGNDESGVDRSLAASTATNGDEGAPENRFGSRSLARSKLNRDGLKAGALAPEFRLPRLDEGGELALSDLRGRRVLLVFSDPQCGPCSALAPELERFHRERCGACPVPLSSSHIPEGKREKGIAVVMISRGEPEENRAKVREHGITFAVLLQQHWEISRKYAMFATPIAYLIDERGVIVHDVAVGTEGIHGLLESVPDPNARRLGVA